MLEDSDYKYAIWLLLNLCLVLKGFYAIAAPLLYHDVIIRTNYKLSYLIKKFILLLSREQRRTLRDASPGEHDAVLVDQERRVDPLWVRRLIVLQPGPLVLPAEQDLLWRYVEDTFESAENLQFVRYSAWQNLVGRCA